MKSVIEVVKKEPSEESEEVVSVEPAKEEIGNEEPRITLSPNITEIVEVIEEKEEETKEGYEDNISNSHSRSDYA